MSAVKHNAEILIGDYQFADKVKSQVLSLLDKDVDAIPQDNSNVKASLHTVWDWEPNNITFRNLKEFIKAEIERYYKPGAMSGGGRYYLVVGNFWANVYEKGDYAQSHCHKPNDFSFAYFVKSNWYHSPLVFTDSGKKIRPKEGRFVAFPSYLKHHVPKHRYGGSRVTLSGNFQINRS
jgi:hypothetical protein